MKIQTLTISDFRCFKHYHLEFTPGTTIVIGRNGAGKSTLIDALKIALSFIFASNKELGDDFLSAGNPSLSINSFDEHDFRMDEETRTIAPDAGIKAKASYNGTSLEWEIYKRSTA
ncbi:MAG: AAA family ATPase, partial [Prevotella sp.]